MVWHPVTYMAPFPNLTFLNMGPDAARKAPDIRAGARIKAPGAIQIATAIVHGATAFLTHDRNFEKVKEIDVLPLDKFSKS